MWTLTNWIYSHMHIDKLNMCAYTQDTTQMHLRNMQTHIDTEYMHTCMQGTILANALKLTHSHNHFLVSCEQTCNHIDVKAATEQSGRWGPDQGWSYIHENIPQYLIKTPEHCSHRLAQGTLAAQGTRGALSRVTLS